VAGEGGGEGGGRARRRILDLVVPLLVRDRDPVRDDGRGPRLRGRTVAFTGWTQHSQADPEVFTENPDQRPRVDPDSGPTL
jgi:hypothetical protein